MRPLESAHRHLAPKGSAISLWVRVVMQANTKSGWRERRASIEVKEGKRRRIGIAVMLPSNSQRGTGRKLEQGPQEQEEEQRGGGRRTEAKHQRQRAAGAAGEVSFPCQILEKQKAWLIKT